MTVLDAALKSLAADYADTDRSAHFDTLKPWLTGTADTDSQKRAAERLGMNENAVKVAIHRLRKRFRDRVKKAIAETLPEGGSVDEELNHLLSVVG